MADVPDVSARSVAHQTDYTQQTISHLENEKGWPRVETILAVAHVWNSSLTRFLNPEAEKPDQTEPLMPESLADVLMIFHENIMAGLDLKGLTLVATASILEVTKQNISRILGQMTDHNNISSKWLVDFSWVFGVDPYQLLIPDFMRHKQGAALPPTAA